MQRASDIINERKRNFFIFCSWTMVAAITLLAMIDMNEGEFGELFADLAVIMVLVGGLIAIRFSNMDMSVFRMTHFLTGINFFYAISIGAGQETVLFWTFLVPPLIFFFFGKEEGVIWGVVFFLCVSLLMLVPALFHGHVYTKSMVSRFLIAFPIVMIVCFGLESSRHLFAELLEKNNQLLLREKEQLEKAFKEIKMLSGLIPICANCKRVRNDDGFWEQVEIYIRNHSAADFSHSICPECAKRLYPELVD